MQESSVVEALHHWGARQLFLKAKYIKVLKGQVSLRILKKCKLRNTFNISTQRLGLYMQLMMLSKKIMEKQQFNEINLN